MVDADSPADFSHCVERPADAPPETNDPIAHREWAALLWSRIDRDGSGSITAEELNCDEFQHILKAVIAPQREGRSTSSYARAEMNAQQAIDFCMRKADLNHDGSLSFEEFSSFLQVLRKSGTGKNTANLIFALFDRDQSGFLDKLEFLEVWRYFLGHRPTGPQLDAEWARLDVDSRGYVSQKQYNQWLRTNDNPLFQSFLSPFGDKDETGDLTDKFIHYSKKDADSLLAAHQQRKNAFRPGWNDHFNTLDTTIQNPVRMPRNKYLFSQVQSEEELRKWYMKRLKHFDSQYDKLDIPEPPKWRSNLSADQPPLLPEKHRVDGRMRNKRTGKRELWNDQWQTPWSVQKSVRHRPGTMSLRCLGPPPAHVVHGKGKQERPSQQQSIDREASAGTSVDKWCRSASRGSTRSSGTTRTPSRPGTKSESRLGTKGISESEVTLEGILLQPDEL
eukprot:TRINITY_DN8534_c0_g1_i2.p1 TRINITY_DN8534_c0_g1~~TRINITY_DN8534_c0_g1_i2.p1  ORF type:complete len:455 (-),score=69.45 TRINITY_DN8534_c0_g1_i2:103-1446(-)